MSELQTDLGPSRPGWGFASCGWLALTGLAPALEEDVYWDLLDEIGWGPKTSLERAAKAVVKRISAADCAGGVQRTQALGRLLAEQLEQWEYARGESLGLSDDKFMALVHHVVGLGQATFLRVQREPELAIRWVRQGRFKAGVLPVFQRAQELYPLEELTEALVALADPVAVADADRLTDQQLVLHKEYGLGIVLVRGGATRIVFSDGDLPG